MIPETRTPDDADIGTCEVTPTQMFSVFAHERRQLAVAYLAQKPAAIPLGDLAEYIAVKEGEPTLEWYERICTDLYHSHLPRMRELGLIRYDERNELVELLTDRTVIAPYLRLTGRING